MECAERSACGDPNGLRRPCGGPNGPRKTHSLRRPRGCRRRKPLVRGCSPQADASPRALGIAGTAAPCGDPDGPRRYMWPAAIHGLRRTHGAPIHWAAPTACADCIRCRDTLVTCADRMACADPVACDDSMPRDGLNDLACNAPIPCNDPAVSADPICCFAPCLAVHFVLTLSSKLTAVCSLINLVACCELIRSPSVVSRGLLYTLCALILFLVAEHVAASWNLVRIARGNSRHSGDKRRLECAPADSGLSPGRRIATASIVPTSVA